MFNKSKKSKKLRILNLSFALAAFVLISGHFAAVNAQKGDPFEKPAWAKPKTNAPGGVRTPGGTVAKPVKPGPPPIVVVAAPEINQRINYYKQMRLEAAEGGQPIPKVTSVLTLEEMSIIGVFRTPRGYAAMVEAKPINLSYTIYPGEKFFDGQLVAIEENRLVFRKVTKMSNGKFIASVENKALRQYTDQEQIRGTAPIQSAEKPAETAANILPAATPENKSVQTIAPSVIISPLDEMSRQPEEKPKTAETEKSKKSEKKESAKKSKKPVKIAKNK
ncbi:MAG: hypothetical protein M3Q99_18780 [Acidobacteriota bacterium]|nr:hypothetical protein [Acidobacteriota bacterium]